MAVQKFVVQLKADGARRAITGRSFEEAALAYLEECHPPADSMGEVVLVVRQALSGHEQCFRIEVASGRAEPCD
jgi:hypothetical protein